MLPPAKSGGVIPLVAIPAIVGAISALATGGAAVANSINNVRYAKKVLAENKRHNQALEHSSKKGSGFYMQPYQRKKQ